MTDTQDTGTDARDTGADVEIVPSSVSVDDHEIEFHVSELAAGVAGASSPFGDDRTPPLPVERLWYAHPSAKDRPNLAGGL